MNASELLDQDFDQLTEHVRRCAAEAPGAPALICGRRKVSYAALDRLLDRVAAAFQRDGMRAGDTVALCGGNSIDYVAVYLGALRAGLVVAPLPPWLAADALARMLGDCGAKVLFLDAPIARALTTAGHPEPRWIALDDPAGVRRWLAPAGSTPSPIVCGPDTPCNIIYSSGTTGAPKGVVQSHLMRWIQVQQGRTLGGPAMMLISTPLCSTAGSVSLLMTLGSRGCAVLARRFDPLVFLRLAERLRASHAMLVPNQLRRILAVPAFDAFDLSSFRMIHSVAAPCPAELKREILRRWPTTLTEIYGTTEGGACILRADLRPDKLHTVGQAGPRTQLRIIDEAGVELPVGRIGEIVAHSPASMTGYLNQPELTAEAEWRDREGKRFIRTGDVGALDEEGFLTITGRKKDMIISGGFNIYPIDLETVLLRHWQVQDAAVIAAPSDRWGETPVAFVVTRPGETVDVKALLDWANGQLGRTQRISEVRTLPALPYSPLGKVLKAELRQRWEGRTLA